MATTTRRAFVFLLSVAVHVPIAAESPLPIAAELPVAGPAGGLEARRLGRDATLSLVSVSAVSIQSWRVGTVSEPTVSPGGGRSPAFCDLDGDGLLDLALVRGGFDDPPARIVILRGDGAGHFSEQLTIPLEGQALALAAADVDGDGKADLVLGTSSSSGDSPALRTYRWLGGFVFDSPRETSLQGVVGTGVYGFGFDHSGRPRRGRTCRRRRFVRLSVQSPSGGARATGHSSGANRASPPLPGR